MFADQLPGVGCGECRWPVRGSRPAPGGGGDQGLCRVTTSAATVDWAAMWWPSKLDRED